MSPLDHLQIEQAAYYLWLEEGQPDGRHEQHWHEARRQLEGREDEGLSEAIDTFPAAPPPARTPELTGILKALDGRSLTAESRADREDAGSPPFRDQSAASPGA